MRWQDATPHHDALPLALGDDDGREVARLALVDADPDREVRVETMERVIRIGVADAARGPGALGQPGFFGADGLVEVVAAPLQQRPSRAQACVLL
jgi:hypothetical protein